MVETFLFDFQNSHPWSQRWLLHPVAQADQGFGQVIVHKSPTKVSMVAAEIIVLLRFRQPAVAKHP